MIARRGGNDPICLPPRHTAAHVNQTAPHLEGASGGVVFVLHHHLRPDTFPEQRPGDLVL